MTRPRTALEIFGVGQCLVAFANSPSAEQVKFYGNRRATCTAAKTVLVQLLSSWSKYTT